MVDLHMALALAHARRIIGIYSAIQRKYFKTFRQDNRMGPVFSA